MVIPRPVILLSKAWKRKRYVLLLLFSSWLFVLNLIAQNPRADSIMKLIRNHPQQDTALANLMFSYVGAIYPGAFDSVVKYNRLAYDLSRTLKYKKGIMRGLNGLAMVEWTKSNMDVALGLYLQAYALAKELEDKEYQAKYLGNIGLLFKSMGMLDSARKYLYKGIETASAIRNKHLNARFNVDLGSIYSLESDYPNALKNFYKALRIFEEEQSDFDIVTTQIQIGNCYNRMKDFRNADKAYRTARVYNENKVGNRRIDLDIYLNIGLNYHSAKKDNDSARIYLLKALAISREMKLDDAAAVCHVNLGNICFDERKFEEAAGYYDLAYREPALSKRKFEMTAVMVNLGYSYVHLGRLSMADTLLHRGLALASGNRFMEFQKIAYEALAQLSARRSDYQEAYKFSLLANELSDSITRQDIRQRTAEIQFQYEMEKKDATTKLLLKDNELKTSVIKEQRLMVAGSLLVVGLIVILLLVINHHRRKQKMLNRKLDTRNQSLRELNQTKDKFFSIIAHDLRSPFTGLMTLLDELDEGWDDFDEEARRKIIHVLKQSSNNTYNLLVNLLEWANSQQEKIVNHADNVLLEPLVDEVFDTLRTRAEMKSHTLLKKIPPDQKVFADPRIVRALLINLVNNGIKFTPSGGTITVRSVPDHGTTEISVEDNGIGIPEKEIPRLFRIDTSYQRFGTEKEPGTGLGLIMCREYVKLLGSDIGIKSTEGKGTTFFFTLPLSVNGG